MACSPPNKILKVISTDALKEVPKIFHGLFVIVMEQGIGKTRCNVFKKQLCKHGGTVETTLSKNTTHILTSKGLKKEKLLKVLNMKSFGECVQIVTAEWLSACLVKGQIVNEDPYLMYSSVEEDNTEVNELQSHNHIGEESEITELRNKTQQPIDTSSEPTTKDTSSHKPVTKRQACRQNSDSSYEDSMENVEIPSTSSAIPSGTWVCAKPSTSMGANHNTYITEKLSVLEKTYSSTQDHWRALGYKKAIVSIKNYHKPLETFEEVLKLPFVGERLALKICEIMETGHLRRLDHIDPKVQLLTMFSGVWGAGPKTAEQWIAQGFSSLDDLRENVDLNFQQKIDLKYYDDINEKMPRKEVEEIEKEIKVIAEKLLPDVLMTVCGSYRRGRAMCGDIDILVSHPDGRSHKGFLLNLLKKLKEKKLVTDDLIIVENSDQRKYMGLCKLPYEGSKYRRIDFIVAPSNEWPLALMHFTGSAHFNRSIRLLAKKKNMSLSEHALRKDVIRKEGDEKLNKGSIVPVFSEKDVFRHMGLDYLEPTERDW